MMSALIDRARERLNRGELDAAEADCRAVLAQAPGDARANLFLGLVAMQRGNFAQAEDLFAAALRAEPDNANALLNHGSALRALGRAAQACESLERAAALDSSVAETWHRLGLAQLETGRAMAAQSSFARALELRPQFADALADRGQALHVLGRGEEALDCMVAACRADPGFSEAFRMSGHFAQGLGRHAQALDAYEAALALDPADLDAAVGRGDALEALGRHEAALAAYDRAIALDAGSVPAHNNRGIALLALARAGQALASIDRALALAPESAAARANRGNALRALGRHAEALAEYGRALDAQPDLAEALASRGHLLRALGRLEEARQSYDRLAAIAPGREFALGHALHVRLALCDWEGYDARIAALEEAVARGDPACEPFTLLAVSGLPAAQLACAATLAGKEGWAAPQPPLARPPRRRGRIRLAYLSADFHDHPVAQLAAGLFEAHDRSRFEITALSFGAPARDAMRARLERAFDRFLDARAMGDAQAARLLADTGVDIAVDLMGYTRESRSGILAHRPAPVQVGFLGYPGTLGAPLIDYLVADRWVVPPGQEAFYTEKVVRLPGSYLCGDPGREVGARPPSRAEAGLPERGFVYCCFNGGYKISPPVFDLWMRLLRAVPGSVLWLRGENDATTANLRSEAVRRGVQSDRLVFAARLASNADHLARHRFADLFLDTLPYNAHSTACDALWAGLPVLSCAGTTFAGRVGASLLAAVGLEELIARDLGEYEALALDLARSPARLAAIRERLARNRATHALFDLDGYRRHLESAYETMWQRALRGEPPSALAVGQAMPAFFQSNEK
jgi:predicted O-linked N-acetylglucosamine transferase (SPINDLY family)